MIATEPFEETWIDFLRAWPKVKFPKGKEPMEQILDEAKKNLPKVAERYEQSELRLLVSLCRCLQRSAGDDVFYLAAGKAGKLLGVPKTKAWRWLWLLEQEQVISVVEKGQLKARRASRYRHLIRD